jgi:hypothetical protein
MKRKFALFVLGMFLISMVGFVSAGPVEDINNFINGVIEFLDKTKLFSAILGDIPEGDLFFAKILFFAIVFSIVYLILGKVTLFEKNTWALWIVSIAASILSIRFITDGGLIRTIILPYSALGVAISAAIPFVIAFLVIETGMKGRKNKTVRTIAWIFFTVVFLALWLTRSVDDTLTGTWEWMYIFTAALSLLMLSMDGTIQRIQGKIEMEKKFYYKDLERRNRLLNELDGAMNLHTDLTIRGATASELRKASDRIDRLEKAITEIPEKK